MLATLSPFPKCFAWAQATEPMSARHDSQCSIAIVAVIKVNSHSDKLIKHRDRRLNEYISFFLRPPRALQTVDVPGNRDTEVLMKRN